MRGALLFLVSLYIALAEKHANVLIILLDDVGWGDLDIAGINHDTPALTPNLKAMSKANSSLVFTRFYSGGSVCSPTRSSAITGRTPSRECIINTEQNAMPSNMNVSTTAAFAKRAGYSTGFFGKWHLGSLTDEIDANCYSAQSYLDCTTGYSFTSKDANGFCCDGRDSKNATSFVVPVATPLQFGFDVALVTSQVSPTASANCGCWKTVNGGGINCELGHYSGSGHLNSEEPWLECDPYFATKGMFPSSTTLSKKEASSSNKLEALNFVSPADDAEFLTDQLINFIRQSVKSDKPFYAQLSFHQSHIPYIAPEKYRKLYENLTTNEQDYFGSLSNVDHEIGRIRSLLKELRVDHDTFLLVSSDNGPEVDNTGGHGTSKFVNPGSNGGLTGRKRALSEGGTRVPTVIEFPKIIKKNKLEYHFPASTIDILPTLIELAGFPQDMKKFVIDGTSLVPYMKGIEIKRKKPIGQLSDQVWWIRAPDVPFNNMTLCNDRPKNKYPPSFTENFTTPFNQPQFAWTDNEYKLFGCSFADESGSTQFRFSLYNIVKDKEEHHDLWKEFGDTLGDKMFQQLVIWFASITKSVQEESKCFLGPSALRSFIERDYNERNFLRNVARNKQ